jgi:phospholipase/carboxylesterase
MRELTYAERPARGEADGLLILHHGRGADEHALVQLADALDRVHRLHVVLPRGPLTFPELDGYHWYGVRAIGYPEPESFQLAYAALCAFHDQIWERSGIPPGRTVLGGFSMGTAMSYATGLGPGRPRTAGILACSGAFPNVDGWTPEFASHEGQRVLITHGRTDPSLKVEFAHRARVLLEASGLDVDYAESGGGHEVDALAIGRGIQWLAQVLS